MKVYKNPRKSIVEFVDDAGKSALRYRGHDRKLHYVASSEDPEGGGGGMTETTWQELKDKRDNGKLIPGSLYRITDYNCTTTQENTQSAGHQFDIVLLALSENKLAEEGWAMMHDNIYNVTFSDGVTKKCWIYVFDDEGNIYLVDVDTLLGYEGNINIFEINEDNKTAQTSQVNSDVLTDEDLPYNYFQNSNLSAWKVWYCLDNDTNRFAWADDREGYLISGQSDFGIWDSQLILRAPGWDSGDKYGWEIVGTDVGIWTKTLDINVGQLEIYNSSDDLLGVATVSSAIKVYNGRGVIYRMIDEWNNDVAYDFKNIQHKKNITDGLIDELHQGTDMYIYPFNIWINGECQDATLVGNTLADDVNKVYGVCNNIILNPPHGGGEDAITFLKVGLNTTCFLSTLDGNEYYGLRDSFIDGGCVDCAIENSSFIKLIKCVAVIIIGCDALQLIACSSRKEGLTAGAIYIGDKKVLTEDALDGIETALNNI